MNNLPSGLTTQDRGVNVDIENSQRLDDFPSLNRIQAQLIQVIDSFDVMEPGTNQCCPGSSNDDADNEDSIISSTSIFSSVFKVRQINKKDVRTPNESPREVISDITKMSGCSECERQARAQDVTHDRPSQLPQPICVQAVLPPAVLCMNPSCVCTHSMGYMQQFSGPNNPQSFMQQIPTANNPPAAMQQIPMANNPPGCMQQISMANNPSSCMQQLPAAHNPSGCMQQIPVANNPQVLAQTQNTCNNTIEKKHKLSDFIQKFTKTSKESDLGNKELYKINFIQPKGNGNLPQQFVFDLVQNELKPETNNAATNTKTCNETTCSMKNLYVNEQLQTRKSHRSYRGIYSTSYSSMNISNNNEKCNAQYLEQPSYYKNLEEKNKLPHKYERDAAKVDVYYFDHGNAAYYRTTDSPPVITTELLAEKTENYATKFWAELFGTVYIAFAFITTFILQFFRFLLYSIVRPLTIGLLQLLSDYFFKPVLATIFNAVLQPPLIFLYNVATSIRDLCEPLADGLGYFLREISVICKSIRLFEIKQDKRKKIDSASAVCNHCECNPN